MAIKGLDNVIANLNKEVKKIEGATLKGLLAAGVSVEGWAIEITPVEFGPLSNSSFSQQSGPLSVTIGFTEKYAPFVHEMPNSTNWTKPGTGNKFLEKAVKNNIPQILGIVQKRAKI